jgi:hypothetical protein
MRLEVNRIFDTGMETIGALYLNGKFQCFTLEDERRTEKVWGETRIPEGEYIVKLRRNGGFHERYEAKFGKNHKGMLHLQEVPGFEYVLIHIGNYEDDTAGCLLVGNEVGWLAGRRCITHSKKAYKAFYPLVAEALVNGECVSIIYKDLEKVD